MPHNSQHFRHQKLYNTECNRDIYTILCRGRKAENKMEPR